MIELGLILFSTIETYGHIYIILIFKNWQLKDSILKFMMKFIMMFQYSDISVIAEIENIDSLKNMAKIIWASDGAVVARGDLGAQIPLEQVPS